MPAFGGFSDTASNNPLAYNDKKGPVVDAQHVERRYSEERDKRLRQDGNDQYIDTSISDKFKHFSEDPWLGPASVKDALTMFPNDRCQMLILGAGWGGIMYAVRMIEAGVHPRDLRIVDPAGGFGGTWYWNRYPGLMCDIESYTYLPLLEETGCMPRHRYSYSEEIRKYANLVADKWGFAESAVFQTQAKKLEWDEAAKEWEVELVQQRKGEPALTLSIRSQFVVTANGVLSWPKLPKLPGLLDFQGQLFHTARWNYSLTGGSPDEPSLTKLKDKRVAVIGTGATGIQVIPHLARWSKHLYVVQRTPSAVDVRNQHETDPEWFQKEVASTKGWQRERTRNFHLHFTTGDQPAVNLVGDGWTTAQSLSTLPGDPAGPKSMEEMPDFMRKLHAFDLPRSARIRSRVEQIVKDPITAKNLQAWYPSWCKRPCFHDDYLATFNEPNVTLLDTAGQGPDGLTHDAVIVGGVSYPVDIIIFATGFREPFSGSPAERANLTIIGRDNISMSEAWARDGPNTLHGVLDHNFPNLFLAGLWQASLSADNVFHLDEFAKHAAFIMVEARRRAAGERFAVTPTAAATEDWATQIQKRAAGSGAPMGCTPGFYNAEGALASLPPEVLGKMSRGGIWGMGVEDYVEHLEAWRASGGMRDIEVRT